MCSQQFEKHTTGNARNIQEHRAVYIYIQQIRTDHDSFE